jgi:hypothetical protein
MHQMVEWMLERRVFILTFPGIWPVGACAIACAASPEAAKAQLLQLWRDARPDVPPPAEALEVVEFRVDPGNVALVRDGDY